MLKQLKQLGSDSMIYGISGVVARLVGILIIPIYTRIFVPEDYGIINLINITFYLIGILMLCSMDNASHRWYYDTDDEEDQKKTFGTWVWFQLSLSAVVAIIIILLSPVLIKAFFKEDAKPIYLILPAIALVTNILPQVITNWYRVRRKPVATVVFTISQTIVTIGLSVLFVVVLRWHITGVFAALTISSTIFSLVALQQMQGWLHIKYFLKSRLQPMLKYALPFIPAAIAYWLLNSTDSYFLVYFKNKAEVGIFGIGAYIASGISLFTGAFQQAWIPFAFSIMNEDNAKQVYATVFLLFGYVMGFLAAMLMIFAPEILLVLTAPAYHDAAWVAGILGYNLVVIGFTSIASIGISIVKKPSSFGIAMMIATVVTIILDIILIPHYGKEGSAIATLAAQLIVPAWIFYKGNKVYPIPFKYTEVVLVMLLMAAIAVSVRFISFDGLLLQVIVKTAVALLMLLFILIANKSKLQLVLSKLKKRKQGA